MVQFPQTRTNIANGSAGLDSTSNVAYEQLGHVTRIIDIPFVSNAHRNTTLELRTLLNANLSSTAILIVINGQSKATGSAGLKALSVEPLYPNNVLMSKLIDPNTGLSNVEYQSPLIGSYAPTSNFIPLVEAYRKPMPWYIDPITGANTVFGIGSGETAAASIGNHIVGAFIRAGLEPPKICIGVSAQGGQALANLGPGTLPYMRSLALVQAFREYCEREDLRGEVHYLMDHGQTNAFRRIGFTKYDEEGDLEERPGPDLYLSEHVYANQLANFYRRLYTDTKSISQHYDPRFFTIQTDITYPGSKPDIPPVNGRTLNTVQALFVAKELFQNIVITSPDYAYQVDDGIHGTAEGYYNRAVPVAMAILRTVCGLSEHRPPQVKEIKVVSPNQTLLIMDTHDVELMKSEFGAYDCEIDNPGNNYNDGDIVYVREMEYSPYWKVNTDGSGHVTTLTPLNPGSNSSPTLGTLDALIVFPKPIVVVPGNNYINASRGVVIGGDPVISAEVQFVSDANGHVQDFVVINPGRYNTLPTGNITIFGGGPTAEGLIAAMPDPYGSNLTIKMATRYQLGMSNNCEFLFESTGRIISSDANIVPRTIFTVANANIIPGGYNPEIYAGGVDANGKVIYARIHKSGILRQPIPMPCTAVDELGNEIVIDVENTCWPVGQSGDYGFTMTDQSWSGNLLNINGMRYPRLSNLQIVNEYGFVNKSILITWDQNLGPNPRIHIGSTMQGSGGPSDGGRVSICTVPLLDWPLGYWNQFTSCEWVLRGAYDVIRNPFHGRNYHSPFLKNTQFQLGTDNLTYFINGSVEPVPGFRAWSSVANVKTVQRVPGVVSQYALRVQRIEGSNSTAGTQIIMSIEGEDAIQLRGKPFNFSAYFQTGANFSSSGNVLTYRIYVNDNANGVLGANVVPTGSKLYLTDGFRLSNVVNYPAKFAAGSYIGVLPGNLVTIPNSARQIHVALQLVAWGSNAAGADDWWQMELPQFDIGTVERPFQYVSKEIEQIRLSIAPNGIAQNATATRVVSANYNLAANDTARLVVANANAITGTLPDANSLPAGVQFRVFNTAGANTFIVPITNNFVNGSNANFVLQTRMAVTIIPRDAFNYDCITGV